MARAAVAIWLCLTLTSCAGESPEVPVGPDGVPDPVLVLGRDVYSGRCANCHADDGGGERGPKISESTTLEQYPELSDMIDLIRDGEGAMPGFDDALDEAELEAVARYVREVL